MTVDPESVEDLKHCEKRTRQLVIELGETLLEIRNRRLWKSALLAGEWLNEKSWLDGSPVEGPPADFDDYIRKALAEVTPSLAHWAMRVATIDKTANLFEGEPLPESPDDLTDRLEEGLQDWLEREDENT